MTDHTDDHTDDPADLAATAWQEVQRIMEAAEPGVIAGLPDGGAFRVDDRTHPAVVSFRFPPLTLSYDPLTGCVVEAHDDGRERAFDRYGRRLRGVLEPQAPGDPSLN